MSLTTGQVLQDRYRIVSLLGQGGMGAVYRAWDLRLGVAVALKEMRPEPELDPQRQMEAREQFHREASVLSRLNHPHLVRVSDFFDEGGNTYLVMAFIEGESLSSYVGKAGCLPEAQVLRWADQLLDALAYCHREGVLHRDIKPQNVVVRPDGNAVLVDFGLVKLWDPEDPRTRTVIRSMGTPQYAPPEQYDPQIGHTDPRSDLYSLGATLYHTLTGQAPPSATSRIVNPGALVPIRQLNAAVSPRLERLLDQAMALQPAARFQTADAMRLAFGALQGVNRPSSAPHQDPTAKLKPDQRGFPLGVAGALIAVLFACVIIGGASAGVGYWAALREGTRVQALRQEEAETTSLRPVEVGIETATPTAMMITPGDGPGLQHTATSTATPDPTPQPTHTPIPTPSDTPTPSCPQVTGPFAGVWQTNRDKLGCATSTVYESWAAQEHFERGMMTWREDNRRIYVHYRNGTWASYTDLWKEGDPEFSCGTHASPPTPIRGFGKIWCTYDAVRNGLGNATSSEVGQTVNLQRFEYGFTMRLPSGAIYVFLSSGHWWIE